MSQLKICREVNGELTEKLAIVGQQLTAIGSGAIRSNRALTDAERAEFVSLTERRDILHEEFNENLTALRVAEAENDLEKVDQGVADPDALAMAKAARRAGIPVDGQQMPAAQPGRFARPTGATFAAMFGDGASASLDGWQSGEEFIRCVGLGLHDSRLRAETQVGDTASLGGFALPTFLWAQVLDSALESEIVRPRALIFPMSTRELQIPAWDDSDRSSGNIAGVALRFEGEAETADVQVTKLRQLVLKARKAMLLVESSNELVADAPNFQTSLMLLLGRALSFGLDDNFLFGGGSTGPMGALVAPATIAINRGTANKIIYDDLLSMFSRMLPGSIARSVWVANPACIPELATLSIVVGTGGSAIPVMTSNNGQLTILTRPVIFSEKAKNLGTKSDISLCDFSQYAIGLRRGATLDKSTDVGFTRDVIVFRLQARIDGMPIADAVLTPLNGASLSAFVTLDVPS